MSAKINYDGPTRVRANELFSATFRIVIDQPLLPGAKVVLASRHVSDFGDPQLDDPRAENFVSVASSGGDASWQLGPTIDWSRFPWNHGIGLELVSGEVLSGETLTITLGGTAQGNSGFRAQSFTESLVRFRLGIDALGNDRWEVLPEDACPSVEVVGNRPVALRAVVSKATDRAQQATVWLKPEDAYGNVAGDAMGEVVLLLNESKQLGRASLGAGRASSTQFVLPNDGHRHRITVASEDGTYFTRSNPFGPSPLQDFNLYFGDLHVMSGHCCGTGNAALQYTYAREAAGLDFAAVTSLGQQILEGDWARIRKATREAHVPGSFVTFLAYEWGGKSNVGGDHCVYFPNDEGHLVPSTSVPDSEWNEAANAAIRTLDLAETIEKLHDHHVMIVPHCGGRRCNLDFFDPALMPMLEIYSCHRTYQDIASEAIQRGIRCGFIANSDDHRGAPGDSHPTARDRFFSAHGGLVAAYAKELTRESLWDAFFARRVYATNGPRPMLTTNIGETQMGGEVVAPINTPLKFSFWTCLDGLLDRVEVMKDDLLIHSFFGERNQVSEFSGECEVRVEKSPHAYYVRVFQSDGGRAWSSPIWLGPPAAE